MLGSFVSFAQVQKTTIYCAANLSIRSGRRLDYGNLDRLLPDSIKAAVLVNPSDDVRLRNWSDLALWMSLHGWKLSSWDSESGGSNGNVSSQSWLIFSRDIYLDDSARALLLERVEKIESSGKKVE